MKDELSSWYIICLLMACGCQKPESHLNSARVIERINPPAVVYHNNPDSQQELDLLINSMGMRGYVHEAMANNPSLSIYKERIEQARAHAALQNSSLYPQMDARLRASKSKRNSSGGVNLTNSINTSHVADVSLSWEADLWGRLNKSKSAFVKEIEASLEDYEAARRSMLLRISQACLYGSLQKWSLEYHKKQALLVESELVMEKNQYTLGMGLADRISQLKGELEQVRINILQAEGQIKTASQSLEVLLGRYPRGEIGISTSLEGIPLQSDTTEFSGNILRSRPDVRAMEAKLSAAGLRWESVQKNWFPKFTLSASVGTQSSQLNQLLDPDYLIWSILGDLTMPIFNAGRLKQERNMARSVLREWAENYRLVVLDAYSEVEESLLLEKELQARIHSMQLQYAESRQRESIAEHDFKSGLLDFGDLLQKKRQSMADESQLQELHCAWWQNKFKLLIVAGYPWKEDEWPSPTNDSKVNAETKRNP